MDSVNLSRQSEQSTLLKISRSIIGTLDYQKVLQIISDGMSEMLEIETAAIYLLEKEEDLFLGATTPPLDPNMPMALRKAILKDHPHISKTVSDKQPQVIPDTRNVELSPAEKIVVELRNLRSILYFPFIQENIVLGVLILGTSNKSRNFTEYEIDLGQTVANQLSIGIQNARLHHDLKIKNEELSLEIEERKKIELALKESEAHLSNALKIAKLGHWDYNIATDEFTFTDEFYEIFHTNVKNVGSYKMSSQDYAKKFVYHEDLNIVEQEIRKAINTNEESLSAEAEHRFIYANGNIGYLFVRYKVIKDMDGKAQKIIGANQDITERKLAENKLLQINAKLEESEYMYRNLFNQAAEGIFLMTPKGEFIQVNEAFAKMHGYSVDEMWNLNIHDLDVLGNRTFDDRKEILRRVLKGETIQMVVEHYHKDGHSFPISVITQSLNLQDKKYLLCFHQDLTQQKLIEEELKQHRDHLALLVKEKTRELDTTIEELKTVNDSLLEKNEIINQQNNELKTTLNYLKETQSKLIQAEKMASLGVLTAGVAHEINNPLNYIMGSYVALENYFEVNNIIKQENISRILYSLKTGLDRATKIVQGLNQFSRDNKEHSETCEINGILDNCLTMLNNQLKHKIVIEKHYAKNPFSVKGNVGQLHQAFLNILTNALQSIADKGTITIVTKKTDSKALVEIIDTGEGISEEILPKVTDPFFTTKAPGEGTGLGLSITYSIIKEHKGSLDFTSQKQKGTKVTIGIPL